MHLNEITEKFIGRAIEVHRHLGPGLLESKYEACLFYELKKAGLNVNQVPLPIRYKELRIEAGYKLDYFVEGCVIVEIKSVEGLHPKHSAQVLTYLKFSNAEVALLINFNELRLKDGIKRFIQKDRSA